MRFLRSGLLSLTIPGLLWLPAATTSGLATQSASGSGVALAAARYVTSIRFLDFDHNRPYRSRTYVRGQVVATVGGRRGAVRHARVKLYRRPAGTSWWRYLGTTYTSGDNSPRFSFVARSMGNARYRVVFGGTARLQPARGATTVFVHRTFHARLPDGSGSFHGRVTPDYAHRTIYLGRKTCKSCAWHLRRTARTGDRGGWQFRVGAPRSGRYWWRVSTPPSTRFVRSYSGIFTTRLG